MMSNVARRRVARTLGLLVVGAIALTACLPATAPAPVPGTISIPADLTSAVSAPPWWTGDCDSGNYTGAHALGASYRGVEVCGPRPGADAAPDRLVRFFPGAWGELEWECVELAMRYMYLAYGVSPYGANGKDVYPNYTTAAGGGLVKVANATAGQTPVPGDVISFGATPTSSFGHAGVVESVTIDGSGNGTLRMMSQNDTTTGWRTVTITSWSVNGPAAGLGPVSGWLHKPASS